MVAATFELDSMIEVWLVPVATIEGPRYTLGGEYGYLFPPDARRELSIRPPSGVHASDPPAGPTYTIRSLADSIPAPSELLLANALSQDGVTVHIEMKTRVATLGGRGPAAVWVFVKR